MQGHEQLGAQQAVAGLVGPHVQPLTLLELAHTQVHHPSVHLLNNMHARPAAALCFQQECLYIAVALQGQTCYFHACAVQTFAAPYGVLTTHAIVAVLTNVRVDRTPRLQVADINTEPVTWQSDFVQSVPERQ